MAVLMNKDEAVLSFTMDQGRVLRIGEVHNKALLPVPLWGNISAQSLHSWLYNRGIPEEREEIEKFRMRFPHAERDEHKFSLSDQYWISTSPADNYDKLNYFTNEYSEEFGKAFFSYWDVDETKIGKPSPDRMTNGVLRKRWVREGENSYLIKAASEKYHQEPLSEVLASIMLKKLALLPYVPYELVIDGMQICSKCKNFVTIDTEFVPAKDLFMTEEKKPGVSDFEHLVNLCRKYGIKDAEKYLNRMIVCDRILCNQDRHLGNFGFIRSAVNGKFLGFAPLFDSGSAYWGKRETVNKKHEPMLFQENVDNAMMNAVASGLIKDPKTTQEMRDLINAYPQISSKKKEDIIRISDEIDMEMSILFEKKEEAER